jgi:hypothetical protein
MVLIDPASSAKSAGGFAAVEEGDCGSIPLLVKKATMADDLIAKFTF